MHLRGSITFRNLSKSELVAWASETQKTYDGFEFKVDLANNIIIFECWSEDWLYSSRSGRPTFSQSDVSERVLESLMDEIGGDPDLWESIEDKAFEISVWYAGLTGECVDNMRRVADASIDEDCETEDKLWPALFNKYGVYDSTTKRYVLLGDDKFLYYSDDFNMLDLQINRAFRLIQNADV